MPIQFNGESYPVISQDKMTPGEIDAVERATGLTFQRITRLGQTCVCSHGAGFHRHLDGEGQPSDDTSCSVEDCDCEQHEADLPTRVSTAFMWVSIKRGNPAVKYDEVANTPLAELNVTAEDVASDPTDAPPQEA